MHLTANISVPQKNFTAIDLHSDNAVICVRRNALNKAGELVGKNICCGRVSIRDGLDSFVKALLPYCQDFDHVAVVESTYNWYCLADVFEERGWLLRIADPSTVSQANLKSSDDRTDAQYLAERLRVGSLKHYLPLSYSSRALWDLCRYRMAMVQDCASLKIKLHQLVSQSAEQKCARGRSSRALSTAHAAQLSFQLRHSRRIQGSEYPTACGF